MDQTMDMFVDIKQFAKLDQHLSENKFKNLRILCIFGFKLSFIYVTNEDKVYGLGNNRFGCLGLGLTDAYVVWPKLNTTLSDKRLVDIGFGIDHCLGLTRSGKCCSWGSNEFGQLGRRDKSLKPMLIKSLTDKRVVQIRCGGYHNLVLTDSGQVYAWGSNTRGQIGDQCSTYAFAPKLVELNGRVVDISCGKDHSMALLDNGLVYVWGSNRFGQLGRKTIVNSVKQPFPLICTETLGITKVVCGSDHSILLTTTGDLYAMGLNNSGQVGNGTQENQWFPVRINGEIQFKNIIASHMCDTSVGISTQYKVYVWGYSGGHLTLEPEGVECKRSVFDIYANRARNRITYKAIVINRTEENRDINENIVRIEDKDIETKSVNTIESNKTMTALNALNVCELSEQIQNSCSVQTLSAETKPMINCLTESFNNPNDYDIRFQFKDQYIFGHKTILRIRNKKFWEKCEQNMNKERNEIIFDDYSYNTFLLFIQYLYTNELNIIDSESAEKLLSLANIYGEEVLKEKCGQLLANSIDSENVCKLYTKAIEQNIQELEKYCLDFVSKNFIDVCLTQEFEDMADSMAKNLMISSLSI